MPKRNIILLLVFSTLVSCASLSGRDSSWSPYIGCSEQELREKWGYGGDSSTYFLDGVTFRDTWYHKNLLFGTVLPGLSSEVFDMNILVTIENGVVRSVSYH